MLRGQEAPMAAKKKGTANYINAEVVPDFEQYVAAKKRRAREADREAIASGRLTPEEVQRKNALTHGYPFKLDFKSAKRLW
jgi:hypothetical protein